MKRMQTITEAQNRTDLPDFRPGDTVRAHVRVIEGEKERIQIFEGVVIGIKGGGNNRTFTVRKVSGGVGVERIFPYNSPMIKAVEITRKGRVRRAKLYYLRDRVGKRARVQEQKKPARGSAARKDKADADPDAGADREDGSSETS